MSCLFVHFWIWSWRKSSTWLWPESCSFEQPIYFSFTSLEKWELLHPVRLVCLNPWARGEPGRGLGNCTLIQQINRPNLTQRIASISSNKGLSRSGSALARVWPPSEQIVAIPPWEGMCPFLALKTKIRKVVFKRLSSWMLSLPEICCEIYVVMKYNNSELWDNSELWNNNWTL